MNIKSEENLNLIISPHLDDAVFSLGGFIYNNKKNTKVLTIFAGTPRKNLIRGWDLRSGFWGSNKAMQARIKENIAALKNLGLKDSNIIDLKFLDKQYRKRSFKLIGNLKEEIFKEFSSLIKRTNYKKINVFIPISSTHTDHKIVRDSFIENLNLIKNMKTVDLYLYQDLPYFYKNLKETNNLNKLGPENLNWERKIIKLGENSFIKKVESSKKYKSQIIAFSKIDQIFKKQEFVSKKQASFWKSETPHCEVVYKIN